VFPGAAGCGEPQRRGLFVTLIQDPPVLSSRQDIEKLVDFAKESRIDILFVQIYRENKAWFPSRIADPAPYQDCFKKVLEDPLGLLIKQAHSRGIQVHAWLNTLSLGRNKASVFLEKYGVSILTKNLTNKKTLEDYKIDGQFFLEPGDLRARGELSAMVEEILNAYPDLDGIQFDYIRYPDRKPAYGYTPMNIERFKNSLGLETIGENIQAWKDWKRAQVTETLECLAAKARAVHPGIQVSSTGCLPYVRAYHEAFQDWPAWLNRGLVDFVTIMDYSPDPREFEKWILEIKDKVPDLKEVYVGIGAYKLVKTPLEFEQEFRYWEKSGSGACVIFHYGSLLENPALAELLL